MFCPSIYVKKKPKNCHVKTNREIEIIFERIIGGRGKTTEIGLEDNYNAENVQL